MMKIRGLSLAALGVLCLLWASAWLVDGAWPSTLASAPRQAMHFALAGLVAVALARGRWPVRWLGIAGASVLVLGVPTLLVTLAQGAVSAPMVSALFALVPVMVVVLGPYVAGSQGVETQPMLLPALTGLAGTLLLLPFALPESYRQAGFMGLVLVAVVGVAMASVWLHDLLASVSVAQALAVACVANGVLFAAITLLWPEARGSGLGVALHSARAMGIEAGIAVMFDVPQLFLLVWLLRELEPARLAARYLLVPLLTVAEGYVLLRPEPTLRSGLGAVLAVGGVWWLLNADEPGDEPRLVLR